MSAACIRRGGLCRLDTINAAYPTLRCGETYCGIGVVTGVLQADTGIELRDGYDKMHTMLSGPAKHGKSGEARRMIQQTLFGETRGGRWPTGCARAPWRNLRPEAFLGEGKAAPAHRRRPCALHGVLGAAWRGKRRLRASSPTGRRQISLDFSAVTSGIKEIKSDAGRRRTAASANRPSCSWTDPPLQQSAAGCVSASFGKGKHHPHRRHHGKPFCSNQLGAFCPGARCLCCTVFRPGAYGPAAPGATDHAASAAGGWSWQRACWR